MCTVILPPGDNPIAVNKYIISYHIPLLSLRAFVAYERVKPTYIEMENTVFEGA